jgi:hypothetical protein
LISAGDDILLFGFFTVSFYVGLEMDMVLLHAPLVFSHALEIASRKACCCWLST